MIEAPTPTAAPPTHAPAEVRRTRQIREAAQAFEAIVVQFLLRAMQKAQLPGGLFGSSPGSSTYESMWERHLSDSLTRNSPFGIARQLEEHWTRTDLQPGDTVALRAQQAARAYESVKRDAFLP